MQTVFESSVKIIFFISFNFLADLAVFYLGSQITSFGLLVEFSLNVFTAFAEFSDKYICHYSKRARTCHTATSCVRDQEATTVPARHMWETGSWDLSPIDASVIYQIPWIHWIQWKFCSFRENSTVQRLDQDSSPTNVSPWVKWLSCHAGYQEVSRCHTKAVSEDSVANRWQSTQGRESTMCLKIRGDVTRSPSSSISGPRKKDSCPKYLKQTKLW